MVPSFHEVYTHYTKFHVPPPRPSPSRLRRQGEGMLPQPNIWCSVYIVSAWIRLSQNRAGHPIRRHSCLFTHYLPYLYQNFLYTFLPLLLMVLSLLFPHVTWVFKILVFPFFPNYISIAFFVNSFFSCEIHIFK